MRVLFEVDALTSVSVALKHQREDEFCDLASHDFRDYPAHHGHHSGLRVGSGQRRAGWGAGRIHEHRISNDRRTVGLVWGRRGLGSQ